MPVTIELIEEDVALATEWKSLRITETLGEPDRLTVDALGFKVGDPGITAAVIDAFAGFDRLVYVLVKLNGDIIFSGLARRVGQSKPADHVIRYGIDADGWQFLAPLRKVGVPDGSFFIIQEDGDPDRLPTAVAVDPSAQGQPTAGSVQALWDAYWPNPTIDLTTFVVDILPVGVAVDDIYWSGTDLEGATSDLAAAGSAAALWWLANDSPDPQNVIAPHLALHFGIVVMPDDGDDGDDLLAGFPSADPLSVIAPFEIDNDDADYVTRIRSETIDFVYDITRKRDADYVRGATGITEEVLPAPPGFPTPYQIGLVIPGGTGWVQELTHNGRYGNDYLDAPAAVFPYQRDAFGQADLASKSQATITGTIKVAGYDGWHKGQGIKVTDADYGFAGKWFLIRSVELSEVDSAADCEYTLTVGDALSAALGFALRQQRLAEERQEVAPATQFVPYVGDLQLDPDETATLTFQLASASGKAMAVRGVPAKWGLLVNGVDLVDPEDTAEMFYLSDLVLVTDETGKITATLHAGPDITAADAAKPWAVIDLPVPPP